MAFNEDSSGSGHDEPWIQWFCGLKGHEMFCEVERSYIEDGFNLYGLRGCVTNFSDCLDLILDRIGPDDSDDSHLTQSACTLYGLIHARYIITAHGLDAMYNKYASKEFGTCPLVQCGGQPVLPVGLRDEMGVDPVKLYCPKCSQVYHTPPVRSSRSIGGSSSNHNTGSSNNSNSASNVNPGTGAGSSAVGGSSGPGTTASGSTTGVDGAAFGTTFPHLFLMTFSNLVPDPLPAETSYVPRVFGFRVHKSARQRNSHNNNATSSTSMNNSNAPAPALPVSTSTTTGQLAGAAAAANNATAVSGFPTTVEARITLVSAGTAPVAAEARPSHSSSIADNGNTLRKFFFDDDEEESAKSPPPAVAETAFNDLDGPATLALAKAPLSVTKTRQGVVKMDVDEEEDGGEDNISSNRLASPEDKARASKKSGVVRRRQDSGVSTISSLKAQAQSQAMQAQQQQMDLLLESGSAAKRRRRGS